MIKTTMMKLLVSLMCVVLAGCSLLPKPEDLSKISPPFFMEVFPPIYTSEGPTAKANIKYRLAEVGETLHFDAGASINRQSETPLNYQWQVVSQPMDSRADFSSLNNQVSDFKVDVPGAYQLKLTVRDGTGREDDFDITLATEEQLLPHSRFVVVGDYGYGNKGQYQVGAAIAQVCQQHGCDMVLGLGDNIYDAGVTSKKDPQFDTKFEKPFQAVNLPFYLVLGNHDTSGLYEGDGGLNIRGDIQIEYSRWSQKPSMRWQMPARYYRLSAPVEAVDQQPLVDFYALDTTLLTNPYDPIPRYKLSVAYKRQSAWLANEKGHSKAQWQIVFAHHPYLSNGKHGNAGSYDDIDRVTDEGVLGRVGGKYVKQFVEEQVCGDADIYLAGHEHSLQYLQPVTSCGKTEFIVSGAGGRADELKNANSNANYWQQGDALGFFYIEIVGEKMSIKAFTVDGDNGAVEHYQRTVYKM